MNVLEAIEAIKNFCQNVEYCVDCPIDTYCRKYFKKDPIYWNNQEKKYPECLENFNE